MASTKTTGVQQQENIDDHSWEIEPPWGFASEEQHKLLTGEEGFPYQWSTLLSDLESPALADGFNATISSDKQISACPHHWIIQPASGATSRGLCKRCGEERIFHNYFDEDVMKDHSNFLLEYKPWDTIYVKDNGQELFRRFEHSYKEY